MIKIILILALAVYLLRAFGRWRVRCAERKDMARRIVAQPPMKFTAPADPVTAWRVDFNKPKSAPPAPYSRLAMYEPKGEDTT